MDGGIHPVEQSHLGGLQTAGGQARLARNRGHHRLPQAVVFRIDGVVVCRHGPDRLHHPGAGPHRVFVEVEPQQPPTPLQGGAVGLQGFHLGASRWRQRGRLGSSGFIHATTLGCGPDGCWLGLLARAVGGGRDGGDGLPIQWAESFRELLDHGDSRSIVIHTHVLNRGPLGVCSPADLL